MVQPALHVGKYTRYDPAVRADKADDDGRSRANSARAPLQSEAKKLRARAAPTTTPLLSAVSTVDKSFHISRA